MATLATSMELGGCPLIGLYIGPKARKRSQPEYRFCEGSAELAGFYIMEEVLRGRLLEKRDEYNLDYQAVKRVRFSEKVEKKIGMICEWQ